MRLEYRAFDKTGHEVSGVMEAAGQAEVLEKLRQQNLFAAEVRQTDEPVSAPATGMRMPRGRTRKLRDLAMFTRQLYSLIHSGTPLTQGLQALERQARDAIWREVITDVRTRVENGSSLSEALATHPEYFDSVYTAMVAAGESSGKLAVLLDRLSVLTRKRVHIMGIVRGAMTYPILLATLATAVFCVLLLFVIPRFAQLFDSIGAPLPPTTAALIAVSTGLRTYWWAVAGGIAAGAVALRFYLKTAAGKYTWDTVVLGLPMVGKVLRSFATARIARMLGVLTDSHLPIQDILSLTRCTASNVHYTALLAKAEEAVAHGEAISSAFRDSNLISPTVYEAIRSGEQSGQVGPLLLELSDFLDEENEVTLKSLTSIIEPVMLVLMGVIVGFVAISIFIPLFDVTSMVSGGGK